MRFPDQPLFVLAVLALLLLASQWLVRHTFFRRFGIALSAIILGAVAANAGVIPSRDHAVYDGIFHYIAPISIFLLLLDVRLKDLRRVGLPVLLLFLAGALGTVLGVLAATRLVPDAPWFAGQYEALAGMYTGTYIGGGLNFNIIGLHYRVMEQGNVFAAATAVDNVISALWVVATIGLPVLLNRWRNRRPADPKEGQDQQAETQKAYTDETAEPLTIWEISWLMLISCAGLLTAEWLAEWSAAMGLAVPSLLWLTTLGLLLAQLPLVARLRGKTMIGSWMIYLFLAVVGAYCDFGALAASGVLALDLFFFTLIILLVHFSIIFGLGYAWKKDWELVAIASQANIGGATTAVALARNFQRSELVVPALIIGALGNAIGTYLGFGVVALLS